MFIGVNNTIFMLSLYYFSKASKKTLNIKNITIDNASILCELSRLSRQCDKLFRNFNRNFYLSFCCACTKMR
ncbi:CLUMA_CG015978, isoform A [Clunio marinus]|uniref:CLUMA_CG015978, isoform A n=1 Tax=Clunio marinus TaxID=568069 RepID=A0A1J1ISY8_9DIPT|nr:CLUMA_CG015978, isoform A [Clunio marinus]